LRGIGNRKEAGMSWIDVNAKMYSFNTADSSSCQVSLADEVLQILARHMHGARADLSQDFSESHDQFVLG
jgi:hypothetical protein